MRARVQRTPALRSRRAQETRAPGVAVCMRAGVRVAESVEKRKLVRTINGANGG